jgi:hypothetical protein
MWFRSLFGSSNLHSSPKSTLRRPPQRGGARRAAYRCRESRRLFLESLADRSLMAFNVLAEYAAGTNPQDLVLAQIDSDGRPDLVIADYYGSSIGVRLGNADGTFGSLQVSSTGSSPQSMTTGDFTGDGITDVVTGNVADISLLTGNGDGTFQPPTSLSLPGQFPPEYTGATPLAQIPVSVATGDLNGDGKLDLVVASDTSFSIFRGCGTYGCYYDNYSDGFVNVLTGNGAGGFGPAEVHHLGTGRSPGAIAVADINGDANADVITANNGDLSVLLGNGTGVVGSPIDSGSGNAFPSISLGDVDGDGKLDTLLNNGGRLSVQKGDGLGGFTAQSPVNSGDYWAYAAVMGDLNADGKLDLVAVSAINNFTCTFTDDYGGCISGYYTTNRQANVLIGNGLGDFASPLTSSLGTDIGSGWLPDVAVADLTGDQLPDLATIDNNAGKAIVAINDGDWNPPPAIAISDAPTVVEGNSGTVNAVFTVSIMGAHSGPVSVNFATADNTAIAGSDYTATSGTLTFGPGDSTPQTISVPVNGDILDEYDEQFYVNLSSAVHGVITDSQGIGTIVDDDPAPQLTIIDVSKNEGNRGNTSFAFTLSLSAVSGKQVSVNYATADGTAKVAGNDYFGASGTVFFAPGQTTATITILVRGDKTKEPNETFFVNLTGATNATISDSQGVATIVNDDGGSSGGGKAKPNSANIDLALLADTLTTTGKRK